MDYSLKVTDVSGEESKEKIFELKNEKDEDPKTLIKAVFVGEDLAWS